MNRTSSTIAIIISLKPEGENNFTVTLLTQDKGIIYAMLYGGPKSKMRSLITQFSSGKIWLYENTEKNQTKITDFEVKNFHSSFSQNLYKMYAASLASEIVLKTHCEGIPAECYKLLEGFFDGMELCDEEQSRVGLIRFLWRFLGFMGVQPDASFCTECGTSFLSQKFAPNIISYYNIYKNSFTCKNCSESFFDEAKIKNLFKIKQEAIVYLSAITLLTPSEVRKLQIDKESYEQIKQIIFYLIEKNVGKKLNSIETGMGIL